MTPDERAEHAAHTVTWLTDGKGATLVCAICPHSFRATAADLADWARMGTWPQHCDHGMQIARPTAASNG